jgi:glycosyltransferase involved in cell wall biosynthesis
LKVAIVHDWLNQRGGAEAVLEALVEMYPQAPIYTSMYWSQTMPQAYRSWDIRTSFMDRLPLAKRYHQPFLPLYPLAFESFDFTGYDLVVSNKSGFCHGVITSPDTLHICYCLTPTRFLWDYPGYARRERLTRLARLALPPFLNYLRLWDRAAAHRVDYFVAISRTVQQRIAKYYRRDSTIIYPPVDTGKFAPSDSHDDYFLIVSRLIPYKRIDLAVRAFNELGLPLVIVGDGRDRDSLRALAKANIEFLGHVPDEKVGDYFARCRAFILPGQEDFCIAPVEAQAAGRPVIAYAAGGALDTVREGATGAFFYEQTPEALIEVIKEFDETSYDPTVIRRHAERFDKRVFKKRLSEFIGKKYAEHRQQVMRNESMSIS